MRWIVRLLVVVLVLMVLAVGAVFLIPSSKVTQLAADQFQKATGRMLTVEGAARPSLWPVLGVKTGKMSISNAEWSTEGPMLQAEGLAIGLDMAAMIGGEIKITKIEALKPQIILERNKDGRGNWEFGTAAAAQDTATPTEAQRFTLEQALISDGSLGGD